MKCWSREQLLNKKIGVLMGGMSAEREISLKTGQGVLQALREIGYSAVAVDVESDLPQQLQAAGIEIAFVALHGRYGEDGRVQGLLEMLQIPYTGSGVMAASMTMDKVMTKQLLQYHQLPTPEYAFMRPGEAQTELLQRCPELPLVVKPSREGSTIGVTIAHDRATLRRGIAEAAQLDGTVLVERYIAGEELTVSVIDGQALPIIQIVPQSGFYDYQAKYVSGDTQYLVPAPLAGELTRDLQLVALKAFQVLSCRGAARVDFMATGSEYFCIEVNTIPGMTPTSLLPKAARAAGIDFHQLVELMLLDADLDK